MRKIAALALAFSLALAAPAQPQSLLLGVGVNPVASGGGGYSGPGDVVASAVGWWGLRAYSAAYATGLGNAAEICTAADAACTVIHVTSAGALNSSDLTTSGCSVITTCTVKTLYDQSGNGHNCVNATEANRPTFRPNGVSSGKPSMFLNSAKSLSCASLPTTTVPWSFVGVASFHSDPGGNTRFFTANDPVGLLGSSGKHWSIYGGSVASSTFTSTLDVFNAIVGRTDGTASGGVMNVSGNVDTGLAPGSGSTGTPGGFGQSSPITGDACEAGYWGSNFSTGNTTAMVSNMQTYWGI